MNDHERKIRAEKANQLLSDQMLKDAIRGVEGAAIEKMIAAPDDLERRRQRDLVVAIRSIEAQLSAWINDGRLIDSRIQVA